MVIISEMIQFPNGRWVVESKLPLDVSEIWIECEHGDLQCTGDQSEGAVFITGFTCSSATVPDESKKYAFSLFCYDTALFFFFYVLKM